MKPVQGRLKKAYPYFTQQELDEYNAIAQEAMKYGYDLVCSLAGKHRKSIEESVWKEIYLSRYHWIDNINLRRLFYTGRYYAWKEGAAQ